MSVDFFDCDTCGTSVCECGSFVRCNCGRKWCSDDCAEVDGFERQYCKLNHDMDGDENCECKNQCWNCVNNIQDSCKYCREEDFYDSELLDFALKNYLNMSRKILIEKLKTFKSEGVINNVS